MLIFPITGLMLSTGECERVCIARALIHEACVILVDEPTGSLDTENTKHILDILKSINTEKGTTLITVTHDERIATHAHRNVTIEDGVLRQP